MPHKYIKHILIINFLLFFTTASHVHSQSLSLSLSPPIIEVIIKPGKTVSQSFKVTNLSDDTVINYQIIPFDDKGLIFNNLEQTVSWMRVSSPENNFLLKKAQTADIILTITPPENTREADYYQALVLNTLPQPNTRASHSQIRQSITALILTTVTNQGLAKSAQMTKFNLPTLVDSFSGLNLDLTLKNTGQSFFRPYGNIILKGLIGEVKYPISPRIHLVNQERNLELDSENRQEISGFFLGRYTLKVDLTLDEGNIKVANEKVFYAFPYKLLLLLTSIGLLFYIFRTKLRGKINLRFLPYRK